MKIAYSGIEGAFAHVVARRLFPNDIHVGFDGFRKTYEALFGLCAEMRS